MKILALLFSLITIVGCSTTLPQPMYSYRSVAPTEHYLEVKTVSLYIDKDFTPVERKAFDQAIKDWNYAMNGYVKIQIVSDKLDHDDKPALNALAKKLIPTGEGVFVMRLNHDHPLLADMEEDENVQKLAFVNNLGDSAHWFVVIADTIGTKNLHKILLHEFGHIMGSEHILVPSLMYPGYGPKQFDCIDRFTMAMVAEHRDLQLSHLNYCKTPEL